MTLFYRRDPIYCIGELELDGLLKVLGSAYREARDNGEAAALRYRGAYDALSILRGGARVEYPEGFMKLFDNLEGGR